MAATSGNTSQPLNDPSADKGRGVGSSMSSSPSGMGSSNPTPSGQQASPHSAQAPGSGANANDVLAKVVQGAHQTVDRLAETAAPHVQRLQEGVASAGDMINSRAGQVRDLGDEWTESLRCTVRENPLAAVATALAVGLLIAKLTR